MKTTIHIINLFEARKDKKLMRVLFSLTLRGESEMRNHMHSVCGDYAKEHPIILVRHRKRVIGWALIHPFGQTYHAHFYVARAFRRKGIGTILYNKAKELCWKKKRSIYCSSWDKISASFFIKNKAKIYGESWQDTTSLNLMDIYLD